MSELNVKPVERRPHLAEHITRSIGEEIAQGRLQPGDRLPTEHFLSENFGVSRNVVREAIASLRARGLIESRQGVGAFVATRENDPVHRVSVNLLQGDPALRNMFEVRAALECQAVALAAFHATPKRLKPIEAALARMRDQETPTAETVNADLDFHRAIAVASGNDYLVTLIGSLIEPMRVLIASAYSRPGPVFGKIPGAATDEHGVILATIRNKDPAAARAAMGVHLVNSASRMGYEISVF